MKDIHWINKQEYPFQSRYIDLKAGKMHYVDEGDGQETLLMLHGNPTWSFLYRKMIKELSSRYRCIAPDYIGFGLSDKPADWDYRPQSHVRNLEQFIDQLKLTNITLVVQDWGGPIGMSYAIQYPKNIRNIIVLNSWMWPVKGIPRFELFSRTVGGPLGKMITHWLPRTFLSLFLSIGLGEKGIVNRSLLKQYYLPLRSPPERVGIVVLAREILESTHWLGNLWSQRQKVEAIPALLLWGMKDPAFRENELKKWQSLFKEAKTYRLEKAGHFIQEDRGLEISRYIEDFFQKKNIR
jgi:haloalkane dehalogenase